MMKPTYEPRAVEATGIPRFLSSQARPNGLQRGVRSMVARVLIAGTASFIACVVNGHEVRARVWNVYIDGSGDAPFIQAAIDSAQNGDLVLVGPGSYPEPYVKIVDKTIEIRSLLGPEATTVKHFYTYEAQPDRPDDRMLLSGFTIEGGEQVTGGFWLVRSAEVIVENCVIRGYNEHSVIEAISNAFVKDCLFEGNDARENGYSGGGALLLLPVAKNSPGRIEVVGCTFRDNIGPGGVVGEGWGGGGAISVPASGDGTEVTIRECLFDGNESTSAGAIFAVGWVWILHNTFVNNRSQDGAVVSGIPGSHGVYHNVFAFNSRYPIWDGSTSHCGCNAYWQNERGDGSTSCIETKGYENFRTDPLFCDPEVGDYRLMEISPLAGPFDDPDHALCEGPIGAFGPGCKATPVVSTSWGSIKARYNTTR